MFLKVLWGIYIRHGKTAGWSSKNGMEHNVDISEAFYRCSAYGKKKVKNVSVMVQYRVVILKTSQHGSSALRQCPDRFYYANS